MKENLFNLDADPVIEREWQDVCRTNVPGNPQCVIDWIRAYMNNNPAYYKKKVLEAQNIFKENGIKYSGETLTAIGKKLAQCEKQRIQPYLGSTSKRPTCQYLPNKEKRTRIKVLAPDAVLDVFGKRNFDDWRKAKNQELQKLEGQQAYEYEIPSVFHLLRELEDDMLNPVTMQESILEQEDMWD